MLQTTTIKIAQFLCSLRKHRTCKSPKYETQIQPCKDEKDLYNLYLVGRCDFCGKITRVWIPHVMSKPTTEEIVKDGNPLR
jgi:hypothetical protein